MSTFNGEVVEEPEEDEKIQTGNLVTESLPHNYEAGGLEFQVDEFVLDGEPLGERGEIDETDRYLSLVDEPGWGTLQIKGSVRLDMETIKEVFPPDEWDGPAGRLALVKTDRLAISRSRTILEEPPIEPGEMSFDLTIHREDHRGRVHVEPFLTRANERGPSATTHASKVGAKLANGEPWLLQLDESRDEGGLLLPIIEDFDDNDRFPDDRHIHYLSLDEPRNPQLYLNRGHPQVVSVLQNKGTTGGSPRFRDVLYDYIEHSVWTQLIVQTARDTDPDTGETKYDWQDDILEIFVDELYPDLDEDEGATQLATDIRNVEDLPALVQNIERAVHQQYDIPSDSTKLVEEAIQSDD